jgi:hypothetical protein
MKTKNPAVIVSASMCALVLLGQGAQAQNLFVGSVGGTSIVEFSGGTQSTFATGLNSPAGLAFDASGDLFEADSSGNIYEWAGAGTTRTTFASGLDHPSYMAINQAGDVFVNINGSAVDEFNPAGSIISTISGITSSGLTGLAFDSAGDLYVSTINGGGASAGFITKITPGGVRSTFASGLNYPVGIAFNAAGDLFVANGNLSDTITEITPTGSESTFASGLNQPTNLAFDKAGDLFVADQGAYNENGDITEIAANGTTSVFSSSLGKPFTLAFDEALPVPEPSTYAFFGLSVAGLLARFCARKKAA